MSELIWVCIFTEYLTEFELVTKNISLCVSCTENHGTERERLGTYLYTQEKVLIMLQKSRV